MAEIFDEFDETLVDPDVGEEASYSWDEEFQRHIIALLVSDRQFLLQSIDLVKPMYFTNKAHQRMCSIAFDFFKKYKMMPKKELLTQEMKDSLKEDKSLAYYLGEVNVVFDYFQPGLDARDYLQDKITYFAKIQVLKNAFHVSLKEIDKNPESEETWSKIYEMMREAMTTHENFELGIDYFKTIRERYNNEAEEEGTADRYITGIDAIDREIKGGGYSKGEIISIVAGSGVGKSVFLANITATNVLRGKRGVYISCELLDYKVAERMDSIFTNLPIQSLSDHKDDIFQKLENFESVDYENTAFVVKHFPAGVLTVNKIRAYLSQLRFHGFDPDFLIVDYIGEMQDIPGIPTHESRERIVRDLRGLASEEDLFVATAMQPNRDSRETQKTEYGCIEEEHLADSFGQIRPLDGAISLNQNPTENKLGLGRGFVMKQRDGKSRYMFYLRFNRESLRITEIARETYRSELHNHKEIAAAEVESDHMHVVKDDQWPSTDEESKE